tara:strand:- start:421 stop:609 length:189 start_codon:yes stop_codon:yes gene_type:complete
MYFWKNKFLPKEVQEQLEKTMKKILKAGNENSHLSKYDVDDYLNEIIDVASGSMSSSNYKND